MVKTLAAKVQAIPAEDRVLSTALARVAEYWELSNEALGAMVGLSAATVSRLRAGSWRLQRGSKPFELSQLVVRLFRSLDSLTGSDDAAARSWLRTANKDLDGVPIELIRTIKGLSEVANYVDDFRARA